ncbi:Acetyltransferase (GNAT) family protein [Streptomyces sp. YIM 130001]|uniref:GNAT family N-acetyltransferase n=1 Tax=Streptomyces sp. YIM 130001 TaxID=2259644 RepID=UPI000E652F38|nr:GNAT family N-acetyltransferase [Streptomyces sp. YIM 130001]RII09213.1 Acetyltransferase (GNAT) family protein [Streptomyces sp. YIM 130001]
MIDSASVFRQFTSADAVAPQVRRALARCWVEVTNAGGAAGFPFPPIGDAEATPAVDGIVDGLAPATSRLLRATRRGELVGWLHVRRDPWSLISHWGTLHHVQTRPSVRGRGHGAALMNEARRLARDDMGLEQLRLAARAGVGLEGFYGQLGWKEIGRWPGALRLAPGDDRDEILMVLDPL